MTGAPYTNPSLPPPVTGRSFTRIGLTLLVLVLVIAGMLYGMLKLQGKTVAAAVGEKASIPWKPAMVYPPTQELPEKPATPTADPLADRLAALERKHEALLHVLERQGQRRVPPTPPQQPRQPAEPPSAPLYITNKVEETKSQSSVKEYTLAPGSTKIPCVTETAINSDVGGFFTARVTTNVYDTATGKHLLVPQGSTILGNDRSESLIYGNERLATVSLTLTLPSGKTVDLGNAPMTDQAGTTGLTGRVNNHFWRLVGAVFVGGALRGGTQAIQTTVASAGPAGSVAAGIGQQAGQTGQAVTSRAMDTRPTIEVDAGQLCHVLLTKPLTLPALWQ